MAGRAKHQFVAAAILFLGASFLFTPGAYAQDQLTQVNCDTTTDASVKMLCKMQNIDSQVDDGFTGIMTIFKFVLLAGTVGVVVVIVFKRMTAKDGEDPMTGAKNVLYIMIIATAIIWIGTEFLGAETTAPVVDQPAGETVDVGCTNDHPTNIAGDIYCYRNVGTNTCADNETERVETDANGNPVRYCRLT